MKVLSTEELNNNKQENRRTGVLIAPVLLFSCLS